MVQAMKLIQGKPEGFLVISGDDMITLPMVLSGGSGVISVIGEGFPKLFSDMVRLGLERKVDESYKIHYKLADAIDMIFEQGNPAGIKEVHKLLGLSENTLRLPLVNVNSDLSIRLSNFIKNLQ
jgi:4-hydroxy-tetrahydrodipicolinate synthase